MKHPSAKKRHAPSIDWQHRQAKLIFNPGAGSNRASPIEIADVIHEMQGLRFVPEIFLVEPGSDLPAVIRDALARGIGMFVVCGGDSTIAAVARALAGTSATLGIIPIGTRNNTALSLGIPSDIPEAIAVLRAGKRIEVDLGVAVSGKTVTPFLEVCSVGLVSTLFPFMDDMQHGHMERTGEFLAKLTSSPPAEIHLLLDGKKEIHDKGFVVLVSNMPYIGLHYQVGSAASFRDGRLDVLFFADLSKLDLLSWVLQGVGVGKPEDARIQHFKVRSVEIDTHPAMPVMADGTPLGEGRVRIKVQRHTLGVMVAPQTPAAQAMSMSRPRSARSTPKGSRTLKALAQETRARSTQWVAQHKPGARLIGIAAGLLLLLILLPANVRGALWHGLQVHTLLAVMLVVFSVLGVSLVWTVGQKLDAWAFLFFNMRWERPIWLDRLMLGLTRMGSAPTALGIGVIFYAASDRALSYEIVLGTVTLWLIVELVKFMSHRSRPFVRLAEARIVGYRAFGRSFPSGHSSEAFFMATLMAQHFHPSAWVAGLLYAFALAVGITRMYVGAHYPRDVLAGALLGSGWGLLGMIVDPYVLSRIG
jgi:diacylglycerol kinase (ATP)